MLHMQVRSFARQSRPTDDVDLRAESPLVKALVDARPVELEKLAELWATLRQQPLPARPDGQWGASESWPTGLLALHTDGRIKLAGSNLAGLHAWQAWWASQPRTENVTALVGSTCSWEASPRPCSWASSRWARRPLRWWCCRLTSSPAMSLRCGVMTVGNC